MISASSMTRIRTSARATTATLQVCCRHRREQELTSRTKWQEQLTNNFPQRWPNWAYAQTISFAKTQTSTTKWFLGSSGRSGPPITRLGAMWPPKRFFSTKRSGFGISCGRASRRARRGYWIYSPPPPRTNNITARVPRQGRFGDSVSIPCWVSSRLLSISRSVSNMYSSSSFWKLCRAGTGSRLRFRSRNRKSMSIRTRGRIPLRRLDPLLRPTGAKTPEAPAFFALELVPPLQHPGTRTRRIIRIVSPLRINSRRAPTLCSCRH